RRLQCRAGARGHGVTRVLGVGLLTAWGEGVAALPDDARRAAGERRVVPMATPAIAGERFRRATRECLLGVAAVGAALRDSALDRAAVAGSRTALVYVTAAAYGASNKRFIVAEAASHVRANDGPDGVVAIEAQSPGATEGAGRAKTGGAIYFPYTAPSSVPAEVAGADDGDIGYGPGAASTLETLVTRRAGETLACAPLVELALARAAGMPIARVTGRWRGRRAQIAVAT